jgi:predicted AlkP superfamily phosphohydrolase/phosphomutase
VLAVIVLDALSVPLVERMLADGRLPALEELERRGRREPLASEVSYLGARQTLYSGLELGDHGLYYPFQWSPSEQRVRYLTDLPTPEAVWERLSRADRRSLVVDPYEGWPPRQMQGVCLSGWQFTNAAVLRRWSVPGGIHRGLARRHGRPQAVDEIAGRQSASWLVSLRRRLLDASGRAADVVAEALPRGRYDLLWVTLAAGHVAGHKFWDLPATLEEVYASVDAALARILAVLPADADLIVLSPVGMGAETSRSDLLPEMLAAVLDGDRRGDTGHGSAWQRRAARARARVAEALPDRLALALMARLSRLSRFYYPGVDWSRTRVFALPADYDGYVRLNLQGREREGVVDPAEAEALLDEVASGLQTFRDPDGTPSVASVERIAELVGEGPARDRLPDLLVRWSDRPTIDLPGVASQRYGNVARRAATGRSGNHEPGAWALVLPGASRPVERDRPPSVVDITATACALLGGDATGLAGEPLLEPRS